MGIGLRQIGKWVQRGRSRCYAAKIRPHKADLVPELHKADFGECLEAKNGPAMRPGRVVGPKRGSKRPENNEFGECCEWGGLLGQYFGHNRFKNREFGRKTGGTGTETTKFTKNAKMVKKSGDLAGKKEVRCSRQGREGRQEAVGSSGRD